MMKTNPYASYLYIFILFLSLLLFSSCFSQKKDAEKETPLRPSENEMNRIPDEPVSVESEEGAEIRRNSGIQTTTTVKAAEKERTLTLQEVQQDKTESNFSLGSQQHQILLPALSQTILLPRDYMIGQLPDSSSMGRDRKAIMNTLNVFFDAFEKGSIETPLIAGGEKSRLEFFLSHYIEEGIIPVAVRFGDVTIDSGGEARLRVRIFGKNNSAEGSVYLINDDKWYISDIQIDFYDIESGENKNDEPYRPADYDAAGDY
ncbi:MAG: hypothetical protein JW881_19295 [Spirochaetales bacterium]|nr:hypothetical protein [Spirochaetales bacterium]